MASAPPLSPTSAAQKTATPGAGSWLRRLAWSFAQVVRRKRQADAVQPTQSPVATRPTDKRGETEAPYPTRPVTGTRPMRKIAIINHKGGVGKTSTTIHLSGTLAAMGYKILIVDCDSQGDASSIFLPGHESLPFCVADIFRGSPVPVTDIIQKTNHENIAILPADERLNAEDRTHGFEDSPSVTCIADAVSEVETHYDYVFFDCPPRPHLSSFAALVSATEVLIPCQASQFSVRSMAKLMQEIALAQQHLNPRLKIRGYFLSMVAARSTTQQKYRKLLVEALGEELVLKTAIPTMATFESAINLGKPISAHSPKSKAAQVMKSFALELIGADNEHDAHTRPAA